MPKPLKILDRPFSSQKEAEDFFYAIRDKNLANGDDIETADDFDLLRELYIKYCEYTDWPIPADPIAFYVRDIKRGTGPNGGTTQGFVVKFSDGSEQEFSAKQAIKVVAGQHSKSL